MMSTGSEGGDSETGEQKVAAREATKNSADLRQSSAGLDEDWRLQTWRTRHCLRTREQ